MTSKSISNNIKKQQRRKRNIEFIVENKTCSKTATHVFKHDDENAIAKKKTLLKSVKENNSENSTNFETYIKLINNEVKFSISLLIHNLNEFVFNATKKSIK